MVQNGSHDTESGIKLDIRSRFSLLINFLFIILVRIVDAKATGKKMGFFHRKFVVLNRKMGQDVSRVCNSLPEFFTLSSQQSFIELSDT